MMSLGQLAPVWVTVTGGEVGAEHRRSAGGSHDLRTGQRDQLGDMLSPPNSECLAVGRVFLY
jgi:hypothetical protein